MGNVDLQGQREVSSCLVPHTDSSGFVGIEFRLCKVLELPNRVVSCLVEEVRHHKVSRALRTP